jgi:hypothetical protein
MTNNRTRGIMPTRQLTNARDPPHFLSGDCFSRHNPAVGMMPLMSIAGHLSRRMVEHYSHIRMEASGSRGHRASF